MKTNTSSNISDSDISSALEVEMDPQNIEVKEAPKYVFIGKDNWRKFLLGATLSLLFVTLFIIADVIIYFIDDTIFRYVFKGYSRITNGFIISAYCIFFIVMVLPTVYPAIGRKAAIPLMLAIVGCYAYIPAFLVRWSLKQQWRFHVELLLAYAAWISSIIGLFVNVLSTKKKFNPTTGVIVALVLNFIILMIYMYGFNKMDPYKFELAIILGVTCGFSYYLNLDVMFMLNKRCDYYLNTDWFLGFVHLHTDLFFRFWRDMFRRDVDYIDTDGLNVKSTVLASAIRKSKLTSIPEASDENDDPEDGNKTTHDSKIPHTPKMD